MESLILAENAEVKAICSCKKAANGVCYGAWRGMPVPNTLPYFKGASQL